MTSVLQGVIARAADPDEWERFERQQREERRLKRVISAIESRSRNIEQRTINFHYRKRAKKVARRAVTLKARMQREAASAEHLDRPAKPVSGFRDDRQPGFLEQAAQPAANDPVIVSQQHAQARPPFRARESAPRESCHRAR